MQLLLFLLPFLLLLQSSANNYSLPDKYFLNCGSKSDANFGAERKFIGDAKPGPWLINHGESKVISNHTIPKSINEIYHTARAYIKPTWYGFEDIDQNGTYVVRLHFFAHTSSQKFPRARFNVSASSGFELLSNFSLENDDPNTPVVKEFAFELSEGLFGLLFSPLESSLAFVNAIEVFLVPDDFKPEWAFGVSPEVRINSSSKNVSITSNALQAVHRVSMGGLLVNPDNDTLWRTWLPDDTFMALPFIAKRIGPFDGNIKFFIKTTKYTAPSFVYSYARALDTNTNAETSIDLNQTWVFEVKKRTKYFIRFHFCDFIGPPDSPFLFDYFLGVNRTDANSTKIGLKATDLAKPFRYEYIIFTDDLGRYNVGIAHNKKFPKSRAFLNGLEIMELLEKSYVGAIVLDPKDDEKQKQMQRGVIIGVCVGGGLIVAFVIGLALFCFIKSRKTRKHTPFPLPQSDPSEKIMSISDLAPNLNNELKISFGEIVDATNDFDEKKIIGVGGFGRVYVGRIGDKEVAVKRSQPGHDQGIKEFQTEVIILSQIRHRFLVSLYGYCDENKEMILVYEYMEGGTLREYLYGSRVHEHLPLSWKQRLEICIDAAKGLDYLHTGTTFGVIIHRDIKTTNILLDKNSKAKVADFGISKTGVPDAKELDTTIRGTYGYLDPEYFNTCQLSEKSDVYAFGVVLFEVLSARPPIVKSLPSEEANLAEWAVLCKRKREIEKLIDPSLEGAIQEDSLRKFVEVAQKCVDEVGANRPSMREVWYDLELALSYHFTLVGGGKGYEESTTMVDAPWEIDSVILGRIPSRDLDDSVTMYEDTTTMNARELVAELKIDCAR